MQVSWIDPEEVASLAESLRLPVRKAPPATPQPLVEAVEPLVIEGTAEPAAIAAALSKPVDATSTPNLAAFRERLQSIREKAIHAGLLTPKPAAPLEEEQAPEPPVSELPSEGVAEESPVTPSEIPESAPVNEQAPPQQEAPVWQPSPVVELAPPPPVEPPVEEAAPSPVQEEAPVWQPSPPVEVTAPLPVNAPVAEFNPPPAPPAPVYTPQPYVHVEPGASVKERLEAFAYWTEQKWGAAELLVVDEYGDLLWGPPKKSGLVLSTMMAWNAAIRASAQAASGVVQIHQQILPMGETLTLIPCQTRLGMLQIAFVKMKALQEHETGMLKEALAQVMDLPG